MAYTHIGRIERQCIAHVRLTSFDIRYAAKVLRRHPSTLYRERQRNSDSQGHYNSHHATQKADQRRYRAPPRLQQDAALRQIVLDLLEEKLSPEQISQKLRRDHPQETDKHISRRAIYDFIAKDRRLSDQSPYGGQLYRHLRCRGRRYRKKPCSAVPNRIPARVGIQDRPTEVETRKTPGDFEADTVYGRGTNACLVTIVDRKTRYVMIRRCKNRRVKVVNQAINAALSTWPKALRRSITFDNGSEFCGHQQLREELNVATYFADPYSAWQRGSNENANKLIRQYLPKGTNFSRISDQEIARIEEMINNRPRKCLNWRSARQCLEEEIAVALGG